MLTDWIFYPVWADLFDFVTELDKEGNLEKTADFLKQAFFFPFPLQAVFRSSFRIFNIGFDSCVPGDYGW